MSGFLAQNKRGSGRIGEDLERLHLVRPDPRARNFAQLPLADRLDAADGLEPELEDVYAGSRTWSDLCAGASLAVHPSGPHEEKLRRVCGRLLHIDDMVRIEPCRRFLEAEGAPDPRSLPPRERSLLRMLVSAVVDKAVTGAMGLALDSYPEVPLQVHARYTRVEILAACGVGDGAKVAPWQTGVYWAKDAGADLLPFTLDKTTGQFSPTTRYRDYAISRDLIHWESQSVVREGSDTGLRYQRHVALGTSVMLFARLRSDERAFVSSARPRT